MWNTKAPKHAQRNYTVIRNMNSPFLAHTRAYFSNKNANLILSTPIFPLSSFTLPPPQPPKHTHTHIHYSTTTSLPSPSSTVALPLELFASDWEAIRIIISPTHQQGKAFVSSKPGSAWRHRFSFPVDTPRERGQCIRVIPLTKYVSVINLCKQVFWVFPFMPRLASAFLLEYCFFFLCVCC